MQAPTQQEIFPVPEREASLGAARRAVIERRRAGRARRDAAIAQAADAARRNAPAWAPAAWAVLCRHIAAIGRGAIFQTVDIRLGNYLLPDPPEPRAWGAIMRRAKREGLIEFAGYAPCNDPRQHYAATTQWRVVSTTPTKKAAS